MARGGEESSATSSTGSSRTLKANGPLRISERPGHFPIANLDRFTITRALSEKSQRNYSYSTSQRKQKADVINSRLIVQLEM